MFSFIGISSMAVEIITVVAMNERNIVWVALVLKVRLRYPWKWSAIL